MQHLQVFQKKDDGGQKASGEKKKKLTMVTDTGGVNDQSFNQSAWEGMTELKDKNGWDVSYLESKQDSDYATNLDKAVDAESDLVWGVGFAMADATLKAAKDNPNTQFAIIDNGNESQVANFTGVMFRAQEPSFVVGYIAARTTKTGKVGFVGGISSALIDQFEYGYRGGVAFANKENNTNVEVSAQYAESFSDAAKGKAIANSMYSDGCDVVFHAAGGVGTGVIEAAKDANKLAIAICTVVLFGTIGMFIYPFIAKFLALTPHQTGFFIGGSLHEVAHVVAASAAFDSTASSTAVIIKMLRVIMLVPFLFLLNFLNLSQNSGGSKLKSIPWFALFFLVAICVRSLPFFPENLVQILKLAASICLCVAMCALGFGIDRSIFKATGKKPFLLAFFIFLWLICSSLVFVKTLC